MLGRRIAARPRPPATVRDLEIALLEEWNSIPQSLIDNLIASMANSPTEKKGLSTPAQHDGSAVALRLELMTNALMTMTIRLSRLHVTNKSLPCFATMETKISVDCHSDPEHIMVKVSTSIPFEGLIYVSERYGDLNCTAFGKKNQTTFLKVPLKGCDTHEKEPGLFMSHVTVQQHPMIVSAGDGEYEVGCKLFNGDLQVGMENRIDIK
ncbi:ZP domain-containing protein [Trichonephila clavipes]|nr:ZP domain-containing protein [Trichonephila clavipes]